MLVAVKNLYILIFNQLKQYHTLLTNQKSSKFKNILKGYNRYNSMYHQVYVVKVTFIENLM